MAKNLKQGDRVEWNTPQGKTTGTVKEKGSGDDPRYVVESQKSGKRAAHKGDALKKRT